MVSPEGERVSLGKNLKARGSVEAWLTSVEQSMLVTLRRLGKVCYMRYPASERTAALAKITRSSPSADTGRVSTAGGSGHVSLGAAMLAASGMRKVLARVRHSEAGSGDQSAALAADAAGQPQQRVVTPTATAHAPAANLAEWVPQCPSQLAVALSNVYWCQCVEGALTQPLPRVSLGLVLEDEVDRLTYLVNLIRGEGLDPLLRRTLVAMVTTDVHNRDITEDLIGHKCSRVEDFEWQMRLRYYFREDVGDIVLQQVMFVTGYGYEYLGAQTRLVATPMTDRCYLTLTGALYLRLGGAPSGPAGTGKTETVKDLGKALGMPCVVFNCSEDLDHKFMGKFLSGIAQIGAWACFDEFNRIDIEVLSVVAKQLLTIQTALRVGGQRFNFEGQEIPLLPTCGVFITMNPGYLGRTELPDNLKALFRPMSMMIPDYALVAEVVLFSEGFQSAKVLSRKMVRLYKLSSEQLSKQDHYDFGMRALKSVLVMAGALNRAMGDIQEELVLIKAIMDSNIPKLLSHDERLFRSIVSDLFPGVEMPETRRGALGLAIRSCCEEVGLQPVPAFLAKVQHLYDTFGVRFGVMLVGPAGSGKTSLYRILSEAMTLLNEHPEMVEEAERQEMIEEELERRASTMSDAETDEASPSRRPTSHSFRQMSMKALIRSASTKSLLNNRVSLGMDLEESSSTTAVAERPDESKPPEADNTGGFILPQVMAARRRRGSFFGPSGTAAPGAAPIPPPTSTGRTSRRASRMVPSTPPVTRDSRGPGRRMSRPLDATAELAHLTIEGDNETLAMAGLSLQDQQQLTTELPPGTPLQERTHTPENRVSNRSAVTPDPRPSSRKGGDGPRSTTGGEDAEEEEEDEEDEEVDGSWPRVECFVLNPKAVRGPELFGEFNVVTDEWKDGLASGIIRAANAGKKVVIDGLMLGPNSNEGLPGHTEESSASLPTEAGSTETGEGGHTHSKQTRRDMMRWVVFDGPVDSLWVENMNTVLDDNQMLCLPNGERIRLDAAMLRMLFEVSDLSAASPATVSRCGMVYVPSDALGWRPYVKSWMDHLLPGTKLLPTTLNSGATQGGSQPVPNSASATVPATTEPSGAAGGGFPAAPSEAAVSVAATAKEAAVAETFALSGGIHPRLKVFIIKLFEDHVDALLSFARRNCPESIRTTDIAMVSAACSIFQAVLAKAKLDLWPAVEDPEIPEDQLEEEDDPLARHKRSITRAFVFSVIWGIGGSVDAAGWEAFDEYVQDMFRGRVDFPGKGGVFDYCPDPKNDNKMRRWDVTLTPFSCTAEQLGMPLDKLMVPTIDTVRFGWLLEHGLAMGRGVFLGGVAGVGKSMVVADVLSRVQTAGGSSMWMSHVYHLSGQTTCKTVQDGLEARLVRKRRNRFGAPPGKRLILFLDDVNLAQKDQYGVQSAIELLRQVLDMSGTFDRKSWSWVWVEDVTFLAASAPPGGGRHAMTPRFIRHFMKFQMPVPSIASLETIYGSVLRSFFDIYFSSKLKRALLEPIVQSAVEIYNEVCAHLLPTPSKSHYTFNLRDLTRVFQGMLLVRPVDVPDKEAWTRLWSHEIMRSFQDRLVDTEDRSWLLGSVSCAAPIPLPP